MLRSLKWVFLPAILLLFSPACNDDEADPALVLTGVSSSFDTLNECDIGGSTMATEFDFVLEFDRSEGIEIDGVEFDLYWSDGDDDQNNFTDNFDVVGNTVVFDWCFRYGTTEWFELDFKLLANGEEIESNVFKLRVEKPEGAN